MTYAALRLWQLDMLSRERPLTEEEQREVKLRAKQERRNIRRRQVYAQCEETRRRRCEQARRWRQNTPGYWRLQAC